MAAELLWEGETKDLTSAATGGKVVKSATESPPSTYMKTLVSWDHARSKYHFGLCEILMLNKA